MNKIFLSFSLLLISFGLSAREWVPKEWPSLKHYDSAHLYQVALPLGGIGTGTVSLGGRGELRDWEIMNVPGKGYSTVTTGNNAPFFAIYTKEQGKEPQTTLLAGPLYDVEYLHYEGRSANHHGMPRFSNASFDAAYPFGQVNLSDENLPVKVRIKAFNPLVPANVEALKKLVAQTKADVGVIYDGDADRVMFVDENSRFISPDLMIAVLGHYFLEERGEKGIVLQDIRSSKAVGEYLAPMGGEMHTWRVGRAFAALKLRELDGVYGGELAGHYYFRDFFYSDSGILASILILNVVAKMKAQGVSLSELIARIEKYQNSGEINFRLDRKQEAMDAVRDYFMSREQATASMDFDGYRVEFPQWWFNIRPSNTEPYLRFLCEATTRELLEEKVAKVREIIAKWE